MAVNCAVWWLLIVLCELSKPTIIVAECVLVYWPNEVPMPCLWLLIYSVGTPMQHSANMLQWLADTFDTALFALYEQVSSVCCVSAVCKCVALCACCADCQLHRSAQTAVDSGR